MLSSQVIVKNLLPEDSSCLSQPYNQQDITIPDDVKEMIVMQENSFDCETTSD